EEASEREGGAHEAGIFASWEPIARAIHEPSKVVASTGKGFVSRREILETDPIIAAELLRGARAPSDPGGKGYRRDEHTAKIALRYLERRAPRLLFLGLGDADEYAHADDYVGYLNALRAADRVLGDLATTLARMGRRGAETTVFFTTDHGRARNFR